jgi:hypothetical protein
MPIHEFITQNTWFIGRASDNSVVHYFQVEENTQLDSGQEIIELFNSEEEYLGRLAEIGINLGEENIS